MPCISRLVKVNDVEMKKIIAKKLVKDKKTGKEKEKGTMIRKMFIRFSITSVFHNPANDMVSSHERHFVAHRHGGVVRVGDSATDHRDRTISHYFDDEYRKLILSLVDNPEVAHEIFGLINSLLVLQEQPEQVAEAA